MIGKPKIIISTNNAIEAPHYSFSLTYFKGEYCRLGGVGYWFNPNDHQAQTSINILPSGLTLGWVKVGSEEKSK